MIMFGAATSMFMFLIYGQLNITFTLWLGIFTGIGVFAGLFGIRWLMRKFKRPSIMAFALTLTITIAMILAIVSNIRNLVKKIDNDVNIIEGEPLC